MKKKNSHTIISLTNLREIQNIISPVVDAYRQSTTSTVVEAIVNIFPIH